MSWGVTLWDGIGDACGIEDIGVKQRVNGPECVCVCVRERERERGVLSLVLHFDCLSYNNMDVQREGGLRVARSISQGRERVSAELVER